MSRVGPMDNPEQGSVMETPRGTQWRLVPTNEWEKAKMASVDGGQKKNPTFLEKFAGAIAVAVAIGLGSWALRENIENGKDIAAMKADSRTLEKRLDNIDGKLDKLLDRKP